jgi:hypothetical protein
VHLKNSSERAFRNHPRVFSDTPSIDALAIVAAFVRFNALDVLFTPALAFPIVFNVRTSSFDHGRRATFFFFILAPDVGAAFYHIKTVLQRALKRV